MPRVEFQCELARASGFRLQAAFDCEDGVTALIGPSGSGKTTILSLVAGLQRPDRGSIRLNGRVLVDTQAGVWLPPERRNVGLVFQDSCLFPHLSVLQNLEYGWKRQPNRVGGVKHVAEVLELGDLLARSPVTLSGGQKQRVALGRALLRCPDLLLLDEPLAGLDEPLQQRVLEYLKRILQEYAVPTIFVSHNSSHVQEFALNTIAIRDGKIEA